MPSATIGENRYRLRKAEHARPVRALPDKRIAAADMLMFPRTKPIRWAAQRVIDDTLVQSTSPHLAITFGAVRATYGIGH